MPALTINVNLSARQCMEPGPGTRSRAILAETGLARARLKLEITESAVLENSDAVVKTLNELRRSASSSGSTTSARATRH